MFTDFYNHEKATKGYLEINQQVRERERHHLLQSQSNDVVHHHSLASSANLIPFLFATFFVR